MQARVDFRLVLRLRVEIDIGIDVLESDPLVMDTGAVGAGNDDALPALKIAVLWLVHASVRRRDGIVCRRHVAARTASQT